MNQFESSNEYRGDDEFVAQKEDTKNDIDIGLEIQDQASSSLDLEPSNAYRTITWRTKLARKLYRARRAFSLYFSHRFVTGNPILPSTSHSNSSSTSTSAFFTSNVDSEDPPEPTRQPIAYYFSSKFVAFVLSHFIFNIFSLVLTLLLAVLLSLRMAIRASGTPFVELAILILSFFSAEIVARVYAYGREFLGSLYFILSLLLTTAAFLFILNVFQISIYFNNTVAIVLLAAQAILRFFMITITLTKSARTMVSANKSRFTKDGFDLDLTYITPRIIAMGLPSAKLEGMYRNPIDSVHRFFDTYHPSHFLIINLCSERSYPHESFHNRVVRFPFDDHNPPPFHAIVEFCVLIQAFLNAHPKNVVAVHCKGGKGRTGLMISSYLLFSQSHLLAEDALLMFCRCRTSTIINGKQQGVSGPSQKRYVQYFEWLRERRREFEDAKKAEERKLQKSLEVPEKIEERKEMELVSHEGSNIPFEKEEIKEKEIDIHLDTPKEGNHKQEVYHEETIKCAPKRIHRPSPIPSIITSPRNLAISPSHQIETRKTSSNGQPSRRNKARKIGLHPPSPFLSFALNVLYHSPKSEFVKLVLHNPVPKELKFKSEREKNEFNNSWNHVDNWTLIISHYRPILPHKAEENNQSDEIPIDDYRNGEPKSEFSYKNNPPLTRTFTNSKSRQGSTRSRPCEVDTDKWNRYNMRKYYSIHDYHFRPEPRENDDDTSVTFNISSFQSNSKSLIVNGDLKFQIFRNLKTIEEDEHMANETSVSNHSKNSDTSTENSTNHSQISESVNFPRGNDNRLTKKLSSVARNFLPLTKSQLPRKLSFGALTSAQDTAPKLFAWFWINTAFLSPSSVPSTEYTVRPSAFNFSPSFTPQSPTVVPPSTPSVPRIPTAHEMPEEFILRKNQLDALFRDNSIDSECCCYLSYFSPPRHPEAMPIEEMHMELREKIRKTEEDEKRKKLVESISKQRGSGKDGYVKEMEDEVVQANEEKEEVKEEEEEVAREATETDFLA